MQEASVRFGRVKQNGLRVAAAGVGFAGLLGACGSAESPVVSSKELGLSSDNGLSINGLSINGLSINGLSINGLSINGLSINGLSTSTFSTWFNQNIASSPTVMSYIVKCAVPAGSSRSWTNPSTGVAYSWQGGLGLAPVWASGKAPTTAEEQIITACLAAHANKYGLHIPVSVLGYDAGGNQLPVGQTEIQTYKYTEGCFFGNVFRGDGIFAGTANASFKDSNSSSRACALEASTGVVTQNCAPIVDVGICGSYCLSKAGYFTTCTYQGKSYKALMTRILPEHVYTCGDGVCQFTESCGTGTTAGNCGLDCGACQ